MKGYDSIGSEWDISNLKKTFIKPKYKKKHTFIYILIFLILVGFGIGLYFLLSKNKEDEKI